MKSGKIMSARIFHEGGGTWQLHVTGVLKKSELDSAQDLARNEISSAGPIKVLLVLDAFEGWERGGKWDDMSFMESHGDQVESIAIVADPNWETEAMMFVGAGFRKTRVKFFPTGQAAPARAWLAASTTKGSRSI